MNYAQYQALRGRYEKKARLLFIVPLIIFIGIIIQLFLLITKTDINFDYLDILMVGQLYSHGKIYMGDGNVVMAFLFFGAIALLILIFGICAFFCKKNVKFAYSILNFLYTIDLFIAVIGKANHEAIVQIVYMIAMLYARRVCSHLQVIPENIWGD